MNPLIYVGIILAIETVPIAIGPTNKFAISKSKPVDNKLLIFDILFQTPDKMRVFTFLKSKYFLLTFTYGISFLV